MRVIIACQCERYRPDFWKVEEKLDHLFSRMKRKPEVIILGEDFTAENWAKKNRCVITKMPSSQAKVTKNDASQYHARNRLACVRANALCVFWDGKAPAYRELIETAKHHQVKVKSFINTNGRTK